MLNHIYFGYPPVGKQEVSADVKAYGLNLIKSIPYQVRHSVFVRRAQLGYENYVNHLPAFARAFQTDKIVQPLGGFYPIGKVEELFPLPYPPLVFNFTSRISEEAQVILDKRNARMVDINKKRFYEMTDYDIEDVREIMKLHPYDKTQVPFDKLNLDAFKYLLSVQRILSIILTIHSYPAFCTDEDSEEENSESESEKDEEYEEGTVGEKRPRLTIQTLSDNISPDSNKKAKTDSKPSSSPSPYPQIKKAKPPTENDCPWGPATSLKPYPGLFFSFVQPLAAKDTNTVPCFIEKYFKYGLGSNEVSALSNLANIRGAMGIVAKTLTGDILAHMCKCIDIGLQAQAIIYPVFVGKTYTGCAVQGYKFSVAVCDTLYETISATELYQTVTVNNPTQYALTQISNLAGVDVFDVKGMRELSKKLYHAKVSQADKERIQILAQQLSFGEVYIRANSNTVMEFIDYLLEGLPEIDNFLPLHPSCIFEKDRLTSRLAAFGLFAPTFNLVGRTYIDISKSPIPDCFAFTIATLPKAAEDWKKLIQSGVIHNNPDSLSRDDQYKSLHGNTKTMIWEKLKQLVIPPTLSKQTKKVSFAEELDMYDI